MNLNLNLPVNEYSDLRSRSGLQVVMNEIQWPDIRKDSSLSLQDCQKKKPGSFFQISRKKPGFFSRSFFIRRQQTFIETNQGKTQ